MLSLQGKNAKDPLGPLFQSEGREVPVSYILEASLQCRCLISIGNHMIARSIWERSARANFSKDNQIAQARRTSAIFSLRKITLVMFPVFIRNCCLKVLENFYSGPPVHTLISFLEARLLASFSFAWGSFGILPQILIENVVTFSPPVRHNVLLCFHF